MGAIRIVCPKHHEDPTHHLGVTFDTPMSLDLVGHAFKAIARCACGAEMVLGTSTAAAPAAAAAPTDATARVEHCLTCGADVPTHEARFVRHRTVKGEACGSSGSVPWRKGRPSDDVVRRHFEEHEAVDAPGAFFQCTYLGCFNFVLIASEMRGGDIRWEYMLPNDAEGHSYEGRVAVPDPGSSNAWWMRPLDFDTSDPTPWRD